MKECILSNGLKLIYKYKDSELTSFSIGIDAGAAVEDKILGVAHATEHMVYKGTSSKTEVEINKMLSELFAFNNAMTNYPYVIYYGSLLQEDFQRGIELLSDIIINPSFKQQGFVEEMSVIKEELKEWDEELEQYCEDKLFFNCYENNRLRYPIIGTKESLEKIELKDIREFYNRFYKPNRSSVAVISSLSFEEVKSIVEKAFISWENSNLEEKNIESEEIPKEGLYINEGKGKSSRIEIIFSIKDLSFKEIENLRIFNEFFGVGVNSVLYDELRTKEGLIYDVITEIAVEKHIRLYKIGFNVSEENLNKSLQIVNNILRNIDKYSLDKDKIQSLIRAAKLKKLFRDEQSIQEVKALSTYEVMFKNTNLYENAFSNCEISEEEIWSTVKKVLKNKTVQIIKGGNRNE